MKRAERPASTMSQPSAKFAPAPAATPFTAQTVGIRSACSLRASGFQVCSITSPEIRPGVMLARSAPAQNARPVPVSTSARQDGIGLGIVERGKEGLQRRGIERVHPVRPVEREHAIAFARLDPDRLLHAFLLYHARRLTAARLGRQPAGRRLTSGHGWRLTRHRPTGHSRREETQ